MKARISIYGTKYATLSSSVSIGEGFLSVSFGGGNWKRILINLLNRVCWRIAEKNFYEFRFEADIPEELAILLKYLSKLPKLKTKDVERWEKMSVKEIIDEISPELIAAELKE